MRLHSVDGGTINECGAVGGIKIGRANADVWRKIPPQCHFVHHKSYMILT
jgi:hypothetical protein